MRNKINVLVLTTVLAPYRVSLFNELGKYCNLTVCFETKIDSSRNSSWYDNNFVKFKSIFLKNWEKSSVVLKTEIISIVKHNNPDVCISYEYSTPTAMLFMYYCKQKKVPYLINCDGGFIKKPNVKNCIKRIFIKNADGLLASGDYAKKYFEHYGGDSSKIYIHNFTSLYEKDILAAPLSQYEKDDLKLKLCLENKKTVIAVGRFIHIKGFDILLRAWKNVNKDYNLLIIGGGEEYDNYLSLITSLDLKNVKLMDFQDFHTILSYFKACDLFVLPTRDDVWGLVINEAMACGMPIISSDRCVAGLELVKNGLNGFIFGNLCPNDLANRINMILNDDELCNSMSEQSIRTIKEYTFENVALAHIDAIKSILLR